MCFKIMPGSPSGATALWFGVRRRVSCIIVGEMHPDIMGVVRSRGKKTRASHGNKALDGSVGSGDNALISILSTCVMTPAGSTRSLLVFSSLIT